VKFIVNGGRRLHGDIETRGSKNAATPIIAATILTKRPCVIRNIPKIGDVLKMIEILESMGSKIEWIEEHTVRITNDKLYPEKMDEDLVSEMRSSILLIGPMLVRFGEIKMRTPGGCKIGVRPMDAHLDAFKELGVEVYYDKNDDLYLIKLQQHNDVKSIALKEFSPTATENLMMFGAGRGELEIRIAATEPHVNDLGLFLKKLGAGIEGLRTHRIKRKNTLDGNSEEISHKIIGDYIEAGTFAVLGVATGGSIKIKDAPVDDLILPLQKLKEFGASFEVSGKTITTHESQPDLTAVSKVKSQPHPGFPSDLQAPFGVLATQASGETLIFDSMYEGRLKYLYELEKMGAEIEILDPHRAIVKGPTKLTGTTVESIDLRAGATLLIAALVAEGESTLHTAEQIDRGYEKIEERLNLLGADVRREE
jgi:UDP-N-acetylglucosamine 1-carboxyvinyltransferase